jgi:hypothetical protein
MSLLSIAATATLGFISDIVLNLAKSDTFIVVSTGALVTLALALIELRLNNDQRELRASIAPDGRWDERSFKTLNAQVEAGIEVRIVWTEDLELDNLPPHRKLVRDLTIFDSLEAVDTTGVQVIYRHPSDRLREFLDIEKEQLKYSESFRRYAGVELVDLDQLAIGG